jgi:L-amino acid N-acyltransferase YncA
MSVRTARPDDAAQVADIYNYYVVNSHATFELDAVDPIEMLRRMEHGWALGYPFLVYESDTGILGLAYAHRYRERQAYSQSVEVSVYIRNGSEGKSIGTGLYQRLLKEIGSKDFHVIIAGIALPNDASIRLHEKFGFRKVAHFEEVGRKFDRWVDVGYWQKILRK